MAGKDLESRAGAILLRPCRALFENPGTLSYFLYQPTHLFSDSSAGNREASPVSGGVAGFLHSGLDHDVHQVIGKEGQSPLSQDWMGTVVTVPPSAGESRSMEAAAECRRIDRGMGI